MNQTVGMTCIAKHKKLIFVMTVCVFSGASSATTVRQKMIAIIGTLATSHCSLRAFTPSTRQFSRNVPPRQIFASLETRQ